MSDEKTYTITDLADAFWLGVEYAEDAAEDHEPITNPFDNTVQYPVEQFVADNVEASLEVPEVVCGVCGDRTATLTSEWIGKHGANCPA